MARYGLKDVYFGGVNISNILKTEVIKYNLAQYPESSTNSQRIAMTHKSSTSRYFTSKVIPLQLFVSETACDVNNLEAILSRLRLMSQVRWKDLTIKSGIVENDSSTWVYGSDIVTWHDVRIENFTIEDYGSMPIVNINFVADDPIGYADVAQTLFTSTGVTSNDTSFDLSTIDIQGTFYIQKPRYTITVNSVTYSEGQGFTVSNGFASLGYDGDILAGDVFIIDTDAVSLTRNGAMVDFSGALPVIDLDVTTELSVTHDYTALDYDILIDNNAGYI